MTSTRSGTKPLPRHGTRARYRLEIKKDKDGKPGVACDRCKAANRKAAAAARASRTANARRAKMHIVEDMPADTIADTSADTPEPSVTDSSAGDDKPAPGPMETAIAADIAEIPEDMRVPMHRSLAVLAIETARDYDKAETPTARVAASRQLKDLIASLRTKREGDGNTALDLYLEDFGSGAPTVPGRSA